MPDLAATARPSSGRSATSSSRSPAAPTPRSSRGWRTTRSAPTTCAGGHRGVAARSPASSGPTAQRWPASGASGGPRSSTDELSHDAYIAERRRPLLLVQDVADGRAGAAGRRLEAATVVLGVNVDDLGDHRPGQRAAAERGRACSRSSRPASRRPTCGLRRASSGCARGTSRRRRAWRRGVPYGTPVTVGVLGAGRAGRGRPARARLPRAAGAPLRRRGADRGAGRRARARDRNDDSRSSRR